MKVVFSQRQNLHDPKNYLSSGAVVPNPEVPERAQVLLTAALETGLAQEAPPDLGLDPARSVHTEQYLTFLEHIYRRWSYIEGSSEEVIPNIHPNRKASHFSAML